MILAAVPTNIITGFLGSGKTSLIKRLLAHKPKNEVWAVLVNEFGQIGLDASLLNQSKVNDVQIKEVAGGCICCAAGVPLQVAVNQLLMKAKPDRLLIEPTGLGHPQAILSMLRESHFQQSIVLNSCITLVDARKLTDKRYTEHECFNQQLSSSELILAAKSDAYVDDELAQLTCYMDTLGLKHLPVLAYSDQQPIPELLLSLLMTKSTPQNSTLVLTHSRAVTSESNKKQPPLNRLQPNSRELFLSDRLDLGSSDESAVEVDYDDAGVYRQANQGEGYFSYGWVFDLRYEFNLEKVVHFIKTIKAERIKLVMITNEGVVGINVSDGELSALELDDAMNSRIEIIVAAALDEQALEKGLQALS